MPEIDTTEPDPLPKPGDSPSWIQRVSIVGMLWRVGKLIQELVAEQREANRLKRLELYYLGNPQSPELRKLLDPATATVLSKAKVDEDEDRAGVWQHGDQHYAGLEERRARLRAQGHVVDDGTDLDELEALAEPK